jgi:ABC-type glycerol-3-phosphate transport system substrate-binding protein
VAEKEVDSGVSPSRPSRREVLKAGIAGAAGLGAASLLGPQAVARAAAPAVISRAPQTVTLMSWFQFEAGRKDAWNALIADFHASQNNYRVKWTGWPGATYTQQMLVQLQSGGLNADVITLIPDGAYRLVHAGVLRPVDDIVAKLGIHPSPAHNYLRLNGHLYGVNTVEVPFAITYNKQLTDKAGITRLATNVTDWKRQLQLLTHKPTQYGIWQPNAPSDFFSWWFQLQNYCLMYDTVWGIGQKSLVNSPKIVAALEVWADQYKNYMLQNVTGLQALPLWGKKIIAEELNVSAAVNQFKTVMTPSDFSNYVRSAPPPWPTRKSVSRLHPLSIVAGTKNMDGAVAFAEFMYAPANNAKLMELCLDVIPSYPEILAVPGVKQWLANQPWATGYQDIVHVPFPDVDGAFIAHDSEFGQIVTQNFQQALIGEVTVKAAMDNAQQQIEDASSRWFK